MTAAKNKYDAVVQLSGGFGNQLFQYAFGMQLQAVHGLRVGYDTEFYRQPNSVAHNRLQLVSFGFDVPMVSPSETVYQAARRLKWLPSSLQQAVLGFTYSKCPADRYESISISPGVNYFAGLWQSPTYFDAIHDEVRDLFRSRLTAACGNRHEPRNGVVGFHVRRGDYLTHAPSYNLDYAAYLSVALERLAIETGHSDLPVIVYSDDPDWCEKNLKLPRIEVSRAETMLDDFLGFMSCEHKIVSNSTFAWWAAFLGDAGGCTVAPQRWHATAHLEQMQILMPDWHVVDY
ncbi:MAG: alpha-1,2-fucosyltransferase [Hyphomicrobiaceae bacterium]